MNSFIHVTPKTKLFVRDIGKGEPVLFLHGWPVNAKMYEYQFTTLPARGIRCIAPDLRGFGKSDAPFTGYSYNQLADDIPNPRRSGAIHRIDRKSTRLNSSHMSIS